MLHPDLHLEFLSGYIVGILYCRYISGYIIATAMTNDLVITELAGGQHSLFYSPFPFALNFNQGLGGIL